MRTDRPARWRTEAVSLSTAGLHDAWPVLGHEERLCRIGEPIDRALVLGSSTASHAFDLERARRDGLTVVRRGSGGGAVLVEPGSQIWLMLYLRLDDPLVPWDLGASFLWLGAVVAGVLRGLGLRAEVVEERQPRTDLGRLICFGDLGFGEVTVEGAKVLGLAQRRSRGQACFQLSLLWWEHQGALRDLLVGDQMLDQPLRVAGLSPLVSVSRQNLQDQLVRAITTL
ncbi:hypothetical protein [Ferrimicrobium sp.]|uniref:lipoyl protein ligase domain-containing protein n=1 Tax=Ferrimicrobium sp. TaxID=2926050 RepID=UPI0026100D12|nr:hypothetical protein [Ferrimicrobium sp.]